MEEVLQWGRFSIRLVWIIYAISIVIGYFSLKIRLKDRKDQSKILLDTVFNTLILAYVVWKFSLILFEPMTVYHNPSVVIYFSGGFRGWALAVLFVFVFLFVKSRSQHIPYFFYMNLLGLALVSGFSFYQLVRLFFEPAGWLIQLVNLLLSILFMLWFAKEVSRPRESFQAMLWFSISQILLLFFQEPHTGFLLGLSKEQLLFLIAAIISLALEIKRDSFITS